VVEHLRGAQQQRARIGDALAGDVRRRAMHRFEDRRFGADVGARRQAQAADQARAQVGDDVAEQVGGDDDVELLRRITSCMQVLSTIISLHWMSGYSRATSRAVFRNRPEVDFRMFALCTTVTFLRPVLRASSKA
jgi:hypothetical protein